MRVSKAAILVSFVALAALVAAAVWLYMGYMRDANRTMHIVRFEDVGGLVRSAGVFHRGLEVGRVADISLDPGGQWVNVVIKVDADVNVRKDATLRVTSQGLFGEAIVEIVDLGSSAERASEGDFLRSTTLDTFDLGRVAERIDASFDDFRRTVQALKGIDHRLQRVEEKLDRLLAKNAENRSPR